MTNNKQSIISSKGESQQQKKTNKTKKKLNTNSQQKRYADKIKKYMKPKTVSQFPTPPVDLRMHVSHVCVPWAGKCIDSDLSVQ